MLIYPVVLAPDPQGGFRVTFVGMPNAVTRGPTEAQALAAAHHLLEAAVEIFLGDEVTGKPECGLTVGTEAMHLC